MIANKGIAIIAKSAKSEKLPGAGCQREKTKTF